MPFKSELLPEVVNEIHVDLHSSGDGQITEKGCVHETLQCLVGRSRIPEVADQQVPVSALQRLNKVPLLIRRQIGKKARGVSLVEDAQIAEALLQTTGQLPGTAFHRRHGVLFSTVFGPGILLALAQEA
ncbi:MAG: Uncharacterised protein [Synechococcus sp. MIT S9220]|nr:MAG: Uncharacterised protein [Synechococcus sp. MIT S9220]